MMVIILVGQQLTGASNNILSKEYDPRVGSGKHEHLVHWMKTTIPVFMYLLVNIENLYHLKTPVIQPPLPEDVPPTPI